MTSGRTAIGYVAVLAVAGWADLDGHRAEVSRRRERGVFVIDDDEPLGASDRAQDSAIELHAMLLVGAD